MRETQIRRNFFSNFSSEGKRNFRVSFARAILKPRELFRIDEMIRGSKKKKRKRRDSLLLGMLYEKQE